MYIQTHVLPLSTNLQVTSWGPGGSVTTHCVHALTIIFFSRERTRSRFASLHPMNGLGGYPARDTLPGYPHPDLVGGVPCWGDTLPGGTLTGRVPPSWTWLGTPPGVSPMAFWVMLQSIMGYGYPPVSAPWHFG